METLLLTGHDIRRILLHVGLDSLMDEMIARLTSALEAFDPERGDTVIPVRQGFEYHEPATGLLEWMPCMRKGAHATIKIVGYHPENPRKRNLPTIVSTVSAYDTTTGHLTCMMDGTLLTALRTGAASAVASGILARPEAKTAGLIGAGAQAVTQLHALTRVFDLREVLVYDVVPETARSFAQRVACFGGGLAVETAPLDALVRTADIVCTATSVGIGEGPVFEGIEPKPWVHVNAVGSDFPGKTELPAELLRRSVVCPDAWEQALREGECQQLAPAEIGPCLYELVQHRDTCRFLQDRITVFDSTGWALEDDVAMHLLMDYAAALGLGTRLPVEISSEDALNPYHFALPPVERTVPAGSPEPAFA